MKVSKGTDYALHAMAYLVSQNGKRDKLPVQELAGKLDVSSTYLSKILARLVKQKYIVATSGAKGGYSLPADWEDISVYDIIVAIDGELTLFEDSFNHGDECKIQRLMMEVEADMIEGFKKKSVEELI
ncbi:RrF2 family transcriptional regulator [Salinicoccus halodurans]|uniref:Rrf2 family transcriptional regulator n=1 Tax=Salinicoccus halodurans TaxID=407035 RepID=A0A0F7D4P8_9STAP|nr:Rrf2 family transcriptional regulator [Salinicoccus halodurans]AKG74610.1 Rrf2 family transcriptional regulator [Salinicoccus halodurans]SFK89247.1 transcriptional regulator, BadM/Rrf2 family [Salinicoccus halodurans]